MKTTYESFEELADAMCKGEGILHLHNCPASGEDGEIDYCIPWQRGVKSFAEWLDHIGVKVKISDDAESFYDFVARERE